MPAIYLLCGGTGVRPGEFINALVTLKENKTQNSDWWGPDSWDDLDNFDF